MFLKFDLTKIEFSHYDIKRGITLPKYPSEELAELVGIILGDGNIHKYTKGKNVGTYMIRIAGDIRYEYDYFNNYISRIIQKLFNITPSFYRMKQANTYYLLVHSKLLVEYLSILGLKSGNKIKNQSTIPRWIWDDNKFLRVCLRGLIDTDGSIYELLPNWPGLFQLTFENHNYTLLKDTRRAFIEVGFIPSKITGSIKRGKTKFYLTRKDQIEKYLKEIGFSNRKHRDRLRNYQSPLV